MKLTYFLLLACFCQVHASSYAQKVTLHEKNASLEKLIRNIEKQSGYVFFLDYSLMEQSKKISVDITEGTLQEAVDLCVRPFALTYTIVGKTIVVKQKAPEPADSIIEVHGKVTDVEGRPLPGVSVSVPGTRQGTVTSDHGDFVISVSPATKLHFSMLGYKASDIAVNGQKTLTVVLTLQNTSVNELVVVGYGTQRRGDVTGAIASVNTKTLEGTPIRSVDQALQGRVAGVTFVQNSGMPGAGSSIRVRGGNSINGSNEPLYVIDGVPVFADQGSDGTSLNPLNSISPTDIASIEILKDASATAIYGSRGGNGVVLITTNRGKRGDSRITFDSYYGSQQILKKYSLLNAAQFEQLANEASVAENGPVLYDLSKTPATTNWQDAIFRTAPIQSYSLSFSGADPKTRFLVTANYFDQQGIARGSDLKRYSLRANLDKDIRDNIKIGSSLTVSNVRTNRVNSGSLFTMATTAPNLPIYQPDGSFTELNNQGAPFDNPIALIDHYKNYNNVYRTLGNVYASVNITKGLTFKTLWGADVNFGRNDIYLPQAVYSGSQLGGNAAVSTNQTFTWLNENTLNYTMDRGGHQLNLLGGFTQQSSSYQSLGAEAQGFLNDNLGTNALGNAAAVQPSSSGIARWALLSFLGRANYSYKNKYLLTLTGRYDGSSRFGKNNRFGFFPSVAVGWKLDQEAFIRDLHVFSNLKLRVSHGLTGNQDGIGNYPSLDLMGKANYSIGNVNVIGLMPSQVGNPDLRWESTAQSDIGLELGFFDNRLTFITDVYYKKTSDLLLYVKIPTTSGFSTSLQNRGQVENKGIELTINATPLDKGVQWETGFNISFNRNKVLDLAGVDRLFAGQGPNQSTIVQVGQPLGTFFGFATEGIFRSKEEVDASAQKTAKPGDIRFRDINNDKKINDDDRVLLGNAQPKFSFGFSNTFSFKGFDLMVLLQGVYGNKLYNVNTNTLENLTGLQNQSTTTLNRWTPDNTNTNIPRATTVKPTARSWDRLVEDGSYLRGKTVQLGYNLSSATLQRIKLSTLKVYVNVQNLFTITNYSGLDPEVSRYGSDNVSPGFDSGAYPNARTISFGINASF
ncbi:SusC/RagA family TonB-linked outer membrane protein [Chitinophaga niabensis]|uniref:TonB-linked outer membrane protein, SusC/RagA family n=1 Tax=Chitinophaga niabensis TaxID=536979 RepID=A0A1N6DID3_9BACT|nr:TonB-dependent receptor [Chitinophaga niabensis]SIN70496.1 TonB-linked outer membrane protein, SusC/RagA family [Chitinophaga niabensis]